MRIVIDTSVIIAVIANESHKQTLIKVTEGAELLAPLSLYWEIGNAFSAMFKRKRLNYKQAIEALKSYRQIGIRFLDVDLELALQLSERLNIYAYDAYFLVCALRQNVPLLSLDGGLCQAAQKSGIRIIEVKT